MMMPHQAISDKLDEKTNQNAYTNQSNSSPSEHDLSQSQILDLQTWFAQHVTLENKPYTLDFDQARAVLDSHKNTLVTARAGSGKTRVIVAKVAYLIAKLGYQPSEVAVFMFNRTAAAEVNQRIAAVEVDGQNILDLVNHSVTTPIVELHIASTFHKYALDLVKSVSLHPKIISEVEQEQLIRQGLARAFAQAPKTSPKDRAEITKLTHNFITRAGQKYPGLVGLKELDTAISIYYNNAREQNDKHRWLKVHQIAYQVYRNYLQNLRPPFLDFNLLMARATELLDTCNQSNDPQLNPIRERVTPLRYIMVDEYQDFSYLFFQIIVAMRALCPNAKLFAVGDDWQAINRFAGSDCNYFLNFANYFPEDSANIPLATNYRSCRRIVENANHFMLTNYDQNATKAIPNNRRAGKIYHLNPNKQRFNTGDIEEDALDDGQYQVALAEAIGIKSNQIDTNPQNIPIDAAKLLKQVTKICRKHSNKSIMLLHRHNFTSYEHITLETFTKALTSLLTEQAIMTTETSATQIRCLTMHRSKGLEADVVILLEANQEQIFSAHPYATVFEIFGDTRDAEIADQQRLLYVAMTRAREKLYILSTDKESPI